MVSALLCGLLLAQAAPELRPPDYIKMADRITGAVRASKGERVLIPRDPGYFDELIPLLEARFKKAGAFPTLIDWSPKGQPRPGQPITQLLETTDVFLWLPFRTTVREVKPAETIAIARWTDQGGAHRQVHFHWDQGSVLADGLPTTHPAGMDQLLVKALDANLLTMSARQQRAAKVLASGQVRVTTPAGTDIRFEIRDRPFNRQDGVATAARMASAKVRVDREVELPAGVLRVAPIEETANGVIVVPEARFGSKVVKGLRLEFKDGKVTSMIARDGLAAVQIAPQEAGDAALRFREFGLGFNPLLKPLPNSPVLPYFAYGSGMVRMSLGDNEELGGSIRGNGFRRWFFFADATVEVGSKRLVLNGALLP